MKTRSRYFNGFFPITIVLVLFAWAGASFGATPKIATGDNHTIFLHADGTLWGTGLNQFGQLGDGTQVSQSAPVRIGSDNKWAAVSAGAAHTLAVKADGTLWSLGSNSAGQLGKTAANGVPVADQGVPVQVGGARDWVAVFAGGSSSFALKGNGTLWGWGDNSSGQLATGDLANRGAPVPLPAAGAGKYLTLALGAGHVLALQTDGTLWGWGDNSSGQLGVGAAAGAPQLTPVQIVVASAASDNDWRFVAVGDLHSVAVKADGTLWSWGENSSGQLGLGTIDAAAHGTPVQVGLDRDWIAVSAGALHSVALKQNGTLWSFGDDRSGQLGDGATASVSVPTRVRGGGAFAELTAPAAGAFHSLALKGNGDIFAFGDNGSGQLGSGSTQSLSTPQLVTNVAIGWVGGEPGNQFTVARRSNGTLWSWGEISSGQLGDNTLIARALPAMVGTATDWTAQAAGLSHTVALKADGTLWSWGDNSSGQLGDASNNARLLPGQIGSDVNWAAVAAGDFHTLALKADGTLWSWGDNTSGQLGDGGTAGRNAPGQIVTGTPGNFDSHWVAVAAGGHSLALQSDGTLWVWGDNGSGQLGDATLGLSINAPSQLVLIPAPTVGYNSNWTAIAAGLSHSLALQGDGTLWAFGSNLAGQLGNGDGALPHPANPTAPVPVQNVSSIPYTAMAAGDSHSAARRADGTLWSFGSNTSGQLGIGVSDPDPLNPAPHATPVQEAGLASDWLLAATGGNHTVALKGSGALWGWGSNQSGQLGDGGTLDKNLPAPLGEGLLGVLPSLAFNGAAIGTAPSQALAIANSGSGTLTVTQAAISGSAQFSVLPGSCGALPFAVPAAGSCLLQVVFTPAAPEGARNATLTVASNDPVAPSVAVALSGTARTPFTIATSVTPAGNGTINPAGPVLAVPGSSTAFTVVAAPGFHVADVKVNGVSQGAISIVTVPSIGANATVAASFAVDTFSVTLNTGAHGSIIGATSANFGATPSYAIVPAAGSFVTDVTVNGVSRGAVTALTLAPVAGNVAIGATFGVTTFTVNGVSGARGNVSPAGALQVPYGTSQLFSFTPSPGYQVVDVKVDGVSQGALASYTLANVVSGGHTVSVLFVPDGDINMDGKVDIADALTALQAAVGLKTLPAQNMLHGDVSPLDAGGIPLPDGHVTVGDALVILKKAVGLVSGF